MATYSKEQNGNNVRYKSGSEYVTAADVPEKALAVLRESQAGVVVDELGDVQNPETDLDESEDENLPTQTPPADDSADDEGAGDDGEEDDSEEEEAPAPTPAPAPAKPAAEDAPLESATPQSEKGFGFKRSKGRTLSIFSNKPHETVKNVGGVMVPLTEEELRTKTDSEIINQLQKLKKI